MTRPETVNRVAACFMVRSGPNGVTGVSECSEIGTPWRSAVAAAFIRDARSGPTVRSMCWSPQAQMWLAKMLAHAPSAARRRYCALVLSCEWVAVWRWSGLGCLERMASSVSMNSWVVWSPLQWTWTRMPARWKVSNASWNSSGLTAQIPLGWSP